MHFYSRPFLFPRKEQIMLVRYKKNKKPACYDSDIPITTGRIPPDKHTHGPFKTCGDCPYPSPGFICHRSEGNCLRTEMEKIHRKNRLEER